MREQGLPVPPSSQPRREGRIDDTRAAAPAAP